jgi:excisionase family DNA binding protein
MDMNDRTVERRTYTVLETARMLGIPRNQVYTLIARDELPALRLGKTILLPKSQIDRLLCLSDTAA